MKRTLLALAVGAATLTAVAPALAQPYGPPPAPGYADRDRDHGDRDRFDRDHDRDHDRDRGDRREERREDFRGGYGFGGDFWRGAPASSWERMQWLQQRIERARGDGSLNPREAYRAQRELDRTKHYIQDARRRYGDLRPQDRAYVDQRLDYVRNLIRWERHNGR